MELDVLHFFEKMPQALPLYEAFVAGLDARLPKYNTKVQKTQISFSNKHGFAFVWLPIRKMKGRPEVYIIVTFGLARQVVDPRILESVEPYPRRWTHHVIVSQVEEIDTQLMDWVEEAYDFSMIK